jgi:hypothetical protein
MTSHLSEPLESYPPLYLAVGELVINWGLAEGAIVNIIAVVYQGAGTKHLVPVIPVNFKGRIGFLRRAFNSVAALAPYADEMRAIRTKAKELVLVRNHVVHGALGAFDEGTGIYTFHVIDTDDDENIHVAREAKYTILDLEAAMLDSQNLASRTNALCENLMETFVR